MAPPTALAVGSVVSFDDVVPFLSAAALGLLVGLERERSHAGGVRQVAGSRTFTLLALAGCLAAGAGSWVVAAGLLAVGALLAVGYRATSAGDPGATTELAALTTYLLGALAWSDTALAAALAIGVTALLTSKARLHSFARTVMTDREMTDAVTFLAMVFVVLPVLPDRDVGPYGALNPRHVWQLAVAMSGISWVGYLATRTLGQRRGLVLAGLAGGFVSASATTGSMGRAARSAGALRGAVAGAHLASVATFVQLTAIVAVADPGLVPRLVPAVAGGTAVLGTVAVLSARSGPAVADVDAAGADADADHQAPRPFGWRPAVGLAGVLTLALLVGRWLTDVAGSRAVPLAAGAAGVADAHAGALMAATLHHDGQIGRAVALSGIAAAIGTNTVVKCVVALAAGGPTFARRVAAGLVPAALVFVALAVVAG